MWPASSDEAEDELDEEEEEEGEEIAAAADEVSAFSGALAAALRELLSSTLGVPEETVKGAPLPELVRALQREWEALLEGLVSGSGGDGRLGHKLSRSRMRPLHPGR